MTEVEKQTTQVGIVIFDDVEVLDFCGPFEVFSTTRLDEETRRESASPFRVHLIAKSTEPVTATGGMRVLPDYSLEQCPTIDVLLVPGGWGTRALLQDEPFLQWLAQRSKDVKTLVSVCTGALLLGKAGLLKGRRATTHWKSLDWMQETFPDTSVIKNKHFVQDGNLYTSAGISAGIDVSLKVVEEYCGETIARYTARHMEYPYPESDARRI